MSRSEIAAFEPLHPDSDLELPASIVAECVHQFLVDYLCIPSFAPEIFDEKSLVEPGTVSSMTPPHELVELTRVSRIP
jgi:hypothetical protein